MIRRELSQLVLDGAGEDIQVQEAAAPFAADIGQQGEVREIGQAPRIGLACPKACPLLVRQRRAAERGVDHGHDSSAVICKCFAGQIGSCGEG